MSNNLINVPGRLHSFETGNVLTGANEIYDDTEEKKLDLINSETARIGEEYGEAIIPDIGANDALLKRQLLLTPDLKDTVVSNILNKGYGTITGSGLGRKYLTRNVLTIDGVSKNILTQEDFDSANTIYVIQYDFDLNDPEGENPVEIPVNCVLEFEGGSVSNGTIDFNYCSIKANKNDYIFKNLIDFKHLLWMSVKWFGAKGDMTTDDTDVFKFLLNVSHNEIYNSRTGQYFSGNPTVFVPSGIYKITECINPNAYSSSVISSISLVGEENVDKISMNTFIESYIGSQRSILYCPTNYTENPFFYATSVVKSITFYGKDNGNISAYNVFLPAYSETECIRLDREDNWADNRRLDDVQVLFFGTGIYLKAAWGGNWHRVSVQCTEYGVVIHPKTIDGELYIITDLLIDQLEISKSKYDCLNIEDHTSTGLLFTNLIAQHHDCLNDPSSDEYASSEKHYAIRANIIHVIGGYTENTFAGSGIGARDIVNVRIDHTFPSSFDSFRFRTGSYEFNAPVYITNSFGVNTAKVNLFNQTSYIACSNFNSLDNYSKAILHRVIVDQFYNDANIRCFTDSESPGKSSLKSIGVELMYKPSLGIFYFDGITKKSYRSLDNVEAYVKRSGNDDNLPIYDGSNFASGFQYCNTYRLKIMVWITNAWFYADGTRATWPVTFNLTNLTCSKRQPFNAEQYSFTIVPKEGYHLPSSITVTMGGYGTGYTYNSETGEVLIKGNNNTSGVVSALTIIAEGVADT